MKEKNRTITELLLKLKGVDVSKYDGLFLNRSLQKRIKATNCVSEGAYYTFLEQDEKEGANFMDSLNISYTDFFRNTLTFSALERIILPSIILNNANTRRKEIRIWSAACAAGQEAYSLAILLEELKNGNSKINFRIFATDQDVAQINVAQDGMYPADALNNMSMKRADQWFIRQGNKYTVKPELKRNIDFSVFDLVCGQLSCPPASIFGDFDLVICANILYYYKPEHQKIIIEKAGNCLTNDGYLVTGETERDILIKNDYKEVFPQSAIFQKIGSG
jgi:chemotaxis protein methyltransferase CheR